MRTTLRIGALGAATTLSLVLAACGGADTGSMADHSSTASATASSSASPGSSATVEVEHNDQDTVFAQAMTIHHRGAVEMADLATTRASSQEVQDLAATIAAAQQPEIEQMTSWLDTWGEPMTTDSSMAGMDHSTADPSMAGMMSDEQMTQLQNATGADFDRMFLQMMIGHHTGAVSMARTEQQQGRNTQALELADSIVTSQKAEIEQMTRMLTTRG